MELESSAFAFFAESARTGTGTSERVPPRYVDQKELMYFLFRGLADAHSFLRMLGYWGTVTATVELLGVSGWGIRLEESAPDPIPAVSRDANVSSETTVVEPLLFTVETAQKLVNGIRWGMGYERESNETALYQGLFEDASRRRLI
jgi:hypothetical protein